MILDYIEVLLVLLFCHALADFTFQTDVMAKLKNRKRDKELQLQWKQDPTSIQLPPGQRYMLTWYYWLSAHALIQGGLIYFFFRSWEIMLIEVISHFIIDYLKCANKTTIHIDQGMHISLKILYCILIVNKVFV